MLLLNKLRALSHIRSAHKSLIFHPIKSSRRGFGDFTVIQDLTQSFINLHNSTLLPWYVLIPVITFSFRSVFTLPLAVLNRKRLVKQQELRPIVDSMYPVLKFNLMKRAQENKNLTYAQIVLLSIKEKRNRQKKLYQKHKCQVFKTLLLPFIQIPLWVMLSLTMRDLSGSNTGQVLDPSLLSEGILWISDLTVCDPVGVLPICLGILSMTNIELISKFNPKNNINVIRTGNSDNKKVTIYDSILNISRLSVVFMMGISSQSPAILAFYWVCSNLFSLLQNLILNMIYPLGYQETFSKYLIDDSKPILSKEALDYVIRTDSIRPVIDDSSSNKRLETLLQKELNKDNKN